MRGKVSKTIALSLALLMLGGTVATGCTKQNASEETKSSGQANSAATASYPLKTDVTLKYWAELNTNLTSIVKNFGETQFAKDIEKATGVKIEYIHPTNGQVNEAFNIMIASGDYPDIIEYRWTTNYPGGPNAALSNNVIIKLNDEINKYSPNLQSLLKKYPDIDKDMKTDEGSYYFYPFLRGEPGTTTLLSTAGPIIRKDWLDDLGMSVPETLDDWYNMLKAFKEKKGADTPLVAYGDSNPANGSQAFNLFDGAFNINVSNNNGFYVDNGKMKYGFMEPGYKEMLSYMKKLYKDGLLDKNFSATDKKTVDSNILNGKSGATYGAGGSNLGTYMSTMKAKDPKFNVIGVLQPVAKKGDRIKYGITTAQLDTYRQTVISTKCKNPDIAAKYLDYGYGKEGNLLYNYGIEGVSYTMKDKMPTYTDLIMKNPDKLSLAQAMSMYCKANANGPFIQDPGYIEQYYELPEQKAALKAWGNQDKAKTQVPLITQTEAESTEVAKYQGDITIYVREMQYKFVTGAEPIENFDKYVDQLKKMNVEKLIQLKQQALDRYNKR